MARGGITEQSVEQARKRLLDRGENPSIDAVRVELGNTGSKTTISRHLKAIEVREQHQVNNQESLSDHLKNLIGELSAQLLKDAQNKIDVAEKRHLEEVAELKGKIEELSADQEQLQRDNRSLSEENERLIEEGKEQQMELSELKSDYRSQAQRVEGLEERLADRGREVESLERKHEQARETLGEFRKQAQIQRTADLEQYEKTVNEAQMKARVLEDQLREKSQDLVESAREASRLSAELMETRKNLVKAEQKAEDELKSHRQTSENKVRIEEELKATKRERDTLKVNQQENVRHKHRAEKLEIELNVTKEILDSLRQSKAPSGKRRQQKASDVDPE